MAKNKGVDLRYLKGALTKIQKTRVATKLNVGIQGGAIPDLSLLQDFEKNARKALWKIHEKALALVGEELELALGLALEANVWQWDYGDGDIVQTGALRDSGRVEVTGYSLRVIYDQEYAGIVHYGGYIHPYGNPNVTIYMPARPWVQAVLVGGGPVPQFDFEGVYKKYAEPMVVEEMRRLGYT